jgi:signal recognition particle subunit SRP54
MGDILTLVEKAQARVDQKQALDLVRKVRSDSFTLEDFRLQLQQVKDLGPLDQVMEMIPGLARQKGLVDTFSAERDFKQAEAIINSMTRKEREVPEIINGSRRRRVAAGSGTSVADVNRLLKQFVQARKLMKRVMPGGSGTRAKMAKRLRSFMGV